MHHFEPQEELLVTHSVYRTTISGLYYLPHQLFPDDRGFFTELSLIPDISEAIGLDFSVSQINLARSKNNVVRGFHAENWHKLVHVLSGVAFCALADIRPESPTFGQVETMTLSLDKGKGLAGSLFVSPGIANSVCVLEGPVDYLYHVNQLYRDRDTQGDVAISLFDQDLSIEWPISQESMIISKRDQASITLRQKFPEKF